MFIELCYVPHTVLHAGIPSSISKESSLHMGRESPADMTNNQNTKKEGPLHWGGRRISAVFSYQGTLNLGFEVRVGFMDGGGGEAGTMAGQEEKAGFLGTMESDWVWSPGERRSGACL